jgi:hypothetical protein
MSSSKDDNIISLRNRDSEPASHALRNERPPSWARGVTNRMTAFWEEMFGNTPISQCGIMASWALLGLCLLIVSPLLVIRAIDKGARPQ